MVRLFPDLLAPENATFLIAANSVIWATIIAGLWTLVRRRKKTLRGFSVNVEQYSETDSD